MLLLKHWSSWLFCLILWLFDGRGDSSFYAGGEESLYSNTSVFVLKGETSNSSNCSWLAQNHSVLALLNNSLAGSSNNSLSNNSGDIQQSLFFQPDTRVYLSNCTMKLAHDENITLSNGSWSSAECHRAINLTFHFRYSLNCDYNTTDTTMRVNVNGSDDNSGDVMGGPTGIPKRRVRIIVPKRRVRIIVVERSAKNFTIVKECLESTPVYSPEAPWRICRVSPTIITSEYTTTQWKLPLLYQALISGGACLLVLALVLCAYCVCCRKQRVSKHEYGPTIVRQTSSTPASPIKRLDTLSVQGDGGWPLTPANTCQQLHPLSDKGDGGWSSPPASTIPRLHLSDEGNGEWSSPPASITQQLHPSSNGGWRPPSAVETSSWLPGDQSSSPRPEEKLLGMSLDSRLSVLYSDVDHNYTYPTLGYDDNYEYPHMFGSYNTAQDYTYPQFGGTGSKSCDDMTYAYAYCHSWPRRFTNSSETKYECPSQMWPGKQRSRVSKRVKKAGGGSTTSMDDEDQVEYVNCSRERIAELDFVHLANTNASKRRDEEQVYMNTQTVRLEDHYDAYLQPIDYVDVL